MTSSHDENDANNKPRDNSGLKNAWNNSAPDLDEDDLDLAAYMYTNDDVDLDVDLEGMPDVKEPEPAAKAPRPPRKKISLSLPGKKLLLPAICLFVILALGMALFQIPNMAKAKLEAKLHAGGFPLARINNVRLTPTSIRAEGVKLDEYGFDEIKNLAADVNWATFITTGNLNGLTLTGIHIGRDSTNIGPGLRKLTGNLLGLPEYRITISDATLDITTDFGELRVTMEATVSPDPETNDRIIKARILSSQYQLGFDSTWNGTLTETGGLDLSGEVVDGRLNIGPMRISRFNGWIGLAMKDGTNSLESQMEAGSATFMDVPLQNLSLVSAYTADGTNMIFRSGISGMPDVLYSADLLRTEKDQVFSSILSGDNLGMFLDYIEEATGHTKIIRPSLVEFGAFRLAMDFESGKRFVGGPLPFAIALSNDDKSVMNGNVLVYPDTLDVRGSLETENELALAFQDYFKIPATNMRQNFIRLDGDIRRFFYFGEPAAAKADQAIPAETAPLEMVPSEEPSTSPLL